jgi:DNA replication protein DnaC
MTFDVKRFAEAFKSQDRYKRHIAQLLATGQHVDSIKDTVEAAIKNIVDSNIRSFVIYGEPQSGKTGMMIAFTARLLDAGFRVIIVLVNDNVQLLDQNLERFRRAKLDPAPRHYNEVLNPEVSLLHGEWIIFCKKNPNL